MHEMSVVSALIDEVLRRLEGHDVLRIDSVTIQVGELTFLSEESLRFGYDVLTEGTILQGSKLKVEHSMANIECSGCGYKGGLPREDLDPRLHLLMPSFKCPKCGASEIKLISGRETVLTHISGEAGEERTKRKKGTGKRTRKRTGKGKKGMAKKKKKKAGKGGRKGR